MLSGTRGVTATCHSSTLMLQILIAFRHLPTAQIDLDPLNLKRENMREFRTACQLNQAIFNHSLRKVKHNLNKL
jgi:hypothetical protein